MALAYAGNYGISADDVQEYGPVVMQTALDHFAGDETWSPEALAFRDELNNRGDAYSVLAAQALESIYNDPPPADNDIKIDLRTGAVSSPALSAR